MTTQILINMIYNILFSTNDIEDFNQLNRSMSFLDFNLQYNFLIINIINIY